MWEACNQLKHLPKEKLPVHCEPGEYLFSYMRDCFQKKNNIFEFKQF